MMMIRLDRLQSQGSQRVLRGHPRDSDPEYSWITGHRLPRVGFELGALCKFCLTRVLAMKAFWWQQKKDPLNLTVGA